MQGLKVQCPGCKKIFHETTEKFDLNVRPNGAMVRLLEPWKGWGWAAFDAEGAAVSTTLCSEMLCPGCTAPLAPSGRLEVILTPEDAQKIQPLNSFSDDGNKIRIPIEEPAPLHEGAKLNDQADAEITHAGETPVPGLEDGVGIPGSAPAIDSPLPPSGPQPPTPKQKTKKKANALKKKAKKRK
ncbi:MAG: hypothetical protein A2W27_08200 [Deltaproteobacteria bacterium RBG_16_44_11]|nr:MAG: hypothetical protein A2W27_08200 [Deltaproteobacteria bacterium RBG_16_44_11]